VSIDGERERSLWSVDVDTGESARFIFSYEDWPKSYQAAVSPDGRYVAHARSDGLYLFDQSTGDTTLLLQGGNELECVNLVFSECERVTPSEWYPDGRKLLIQRLVYEGTWPEVLEPFNSPPLVLNPGDRSYPATGRVSPTGTAACGLGVFAGLTGLFLMEEPDWIPHELFPAPTGGGPDPAVSAVAGCDWASGNEVVYLTFSTADGPGGVNFFSRTGSSFSTIIELPEAPDCCTGNIQVEPGAGFANFQFLVTAGQAAIWSRPTAVDLQTGEASSLLEDGDLILDTFVR
jgi:hypothetical protein